MVLVRVSEHHRRQVAAPPGNGLAEAAQREFGIRAAIDQHGRPGWSDDQDRIALADVERGQMYAPIRQGGECRAREQGDDDRRESQWSRPEASGALGKVGHPGPRRGACRLGRRRCLQRHRFGWHRCSIGPRPATPEQDQRWVPHSR